MDPTQLKAALIAAAFQAAAQDLQGVASIDGVPVNATSNFSDPGQQKKNVLVYETAKVYYAAMLEALQDTTGVWPAPKVAAPPAGSGQGAGQPNTSQIANALTALGQTAAAGSPLAITIATLLPLLQTSVPAAGATSTGPTVPSLGSALAGS